MHCGLDMSTTRCWWGPNFNWTKFNYSAKIWVLFGHILDRTEITNVFDFIQTDPPATSIFVEGALMRQFMQHIAITIAILAIRSHNSKHKKGLSEILFFCIVFHCALWPAAELIKHLICEESTFPWIFISLVSLIVFFLLQRFTNKMFFLFFSANWRKSLYYFIQNKKRKPKQLQRDFSIKINRTMIEGVSVSMLRLIAMRNYIGFTSFQFWTFSKDPRRIEGIKLSNYLHTKILVECRRQCETLNSCPVIWVLIVCG